MAMWAGVQNVSRPMERCQEMSHWPPIMAEVTPKTAHQTYQGTRSTAVRTGVETDEFVVVVDAMLSLCTFTIIAFCGAGLQSCAGLSRTRSSRDANACVLAGGRLDRLAEDFH